MLGIFGSINPGNATYRAKVVIHCDELVADAAHPAIFGQHPRVGYRGDTLTCLGQVQSIALSIGCSDGECSLIRLEHFINLSAIQTVVCRRHASGAKTRRRDQHAKSREKEFFYTDVSHRCHGTAPWRDPMGL